MLQSCDAASTALPYFDTAAAEFAPEVRIVLVSITQGSGVTVYTLPNAREPQKGEQDFEFQI
jgi:hypothetical protein